MFLLKKRFFQSVEQYCAFNVLFWIQHCNLSISLRSNLLVLSLSLWTRGVLHGRCEGVRDRYVCVSHFFTANLFKHARVLVSVRKMKFFLPFQPSASNKVITRDFKWLIKALLLMALEYSRNKFLFMTQKDSIVTNYNLQQWHKCKVINDFFFWWFQDVQFKKVNKNC